MSDDPSLSLAAVQAIFADELPITGWGKCYLASAPATEVPVIAVDATGRPDVTDLGRVVGLEPRGVTVGSIHLRSLFRHPEGFVACSVAFTSPVTCSLKVIFRLPRQRDLALAIVAASKFVISPEPLDADGNFDASHGIALACTDPTGVLRQAVALADSWAIP
jgi:hypothetical protein